MASRIEQYALLGDTQTAALVSDDGSLDWLCAPRFDSSACFAALLGTPEHGRWLLAPAGGGRATRRRYRDGTLVLESEFETHQGVVRVVDCMPIRDRDVDVVRVVEGVRGTVPMEMVLTIRFENGSVVPWVRKIEDATVAVAGPDALALRTPVETRGRELHTVAEFRVSEGDRIPFVLTWFASHREMPKRIEGLRALAETTAWWHRWSGRASYQGEHAALVQRAAITLKALTYAPTGGLIAAPTTSLPEWLGGVRNWDYRYCWLRDATFSLYALMSVGYVDEARAWRDWLLRALAGQPQQAQIMYGPAGERRLSEYEVDWLPGYEGSRPVRIGNAASEQFQLDIYGEVLDTLHLANRVGIPPDPSVWPLVLTIVDFLEEAWHRPDEGIWEVRGERQHFTHSKIMAWVAFDRAVKAVRELPMEGVDTARWEALRDEIHAQVCEQGYDPARNTFVQHYGSDALDASLLLIPLVGFLPATDPRVQGTIAAIERELVVDGFVRRYATEEGVDGLPGGEGAFLPCSFWLADNFALTGRIDDARSLFERLIGLCNDVGLISEEYDPERQRMLGNFPQAMTHVALVNTACNLAGHGGPARTRSGIAQPAEITSIAAASQRPSAAGTTT
ncbi:MAG TPA: glycoside hydrolase family 15 protein [Acidimicrobiia bacterium]